MRRDFIDGLRSKYSQSTYDLFNNNCNNFSDEVAQFLTGNSIPVSVCTACIPLMSYRKRVPLCGRHLRSLRQGASSKLVHLASNCWLLSHCHTLDWNVGQELTNFLSATFYSCSERCQLKASHLLATTTS